MSTTLARSETEAPALASAPSGHERTLSSADPAAYLAAHPPGPSTDYLRVLGALMKLHNGHHATRDKRISYKTMADRQRFVFTFFREMRRHTPYKNLDPRQLAGRHVRHMVGRWLDRGLSAATLHNYLSFLRTFAGWLGKQGMVREPAFYVGKDSPLAHRSQAAVQDKSWTARNIDIAAKIAEVTAFDPWVGAQLALCAEFALRAKEARHFRPHEAVIPREAANARDAAAFPECETFVRISRGTKGGRSRDIPLATAAQQALIERLKLVVRPGKFVGNPDHTEPQARDRFYYVIRKFGVSKKALGVVAHGLRHQKVNDVYGQEAGNCSPVRGGEMRPPLDDEARRRAAHLLGHGRVQVTSCYLGASPHGGGTSRKAPSPGAPKDAVSP